MKKCISLILALAVVSCLLSICIPSVCAAEDDSYYYYKVKVTTKIDGDSPSEDFVVTYNFHGVNNLHQNFVMTPYSVDGNLSDRADAHFQPGDTEQTNVFVFRNEEPVIGVRFIQEEDSLAGMTYDDDEYYLEFAEQTQQPGLENAMYLDRLCLIKGFLDGGIKILSDLMDISFDLKYNAPPVFSGVEDGGEYFTTQEICVQDEDLVSVMLDDEPIEIENGEALFTIAGDTNKSYTITLKDAVSTLQLTVTMHELDELMAPVSHINEKNVKAENIDTILMTLNDINAVISRETTPSTEEKAHIDTMKNELQSLLSRIDEALSCKDSDNIKYTKDITVDNVKATDKELLEKAESDLKKALEEYDGNYSDSEKKALQDDLTRVSAALKVLKQSEETVIESPNTGDNSHLTLWLALFVLSGAALVTAKRKIA
jgi:LPXTG-motif cell wall-anchored protein